MEENTMKKTTQTTEKRYQMALYKTFNGLEYTFKVGFDTRFAVKTNQDPYFSITGEAYQVGKPKTDRYMECCGAIGEDFKKLFPEFAHLEQYHLVSTREPMHYAANAIYHASAKDHNGLLKGEKQFKDEYTLKFEGFPFTFKIKSSAFDAVLKETTDWKAWTVAPVEHINKNGDTYKFSPKYTLKNSVGELLNSEWYKCEFDEEQEAIEMLTALQTLKWSYKAEPVLYRIGEGKEPNLKAARDSACWQDAELEDFTAEKLAKRLPKMMKQFKKDIEKFGLTWPSEFNRKESQAV